MSDNNEKISALEVKTLRSKTGAGMMDCKRALEESCGDLDEAIRILREKGLAKAKQRSSRVANQGVVESYIHIGQQVGSIVELNCETDFVARNSDFLELAHQIAMHVVACDPQYLDRDSVPQEVLEAEKDIYRAQAESEGKPEKVIDRIVEGKLEKFYEDYCLLKQPFAKDASFSVEQVIMEKTSQLGENLKVRRYCRFRVGEDSTEEEKQSDSEDQ